MNTVKRGDKLENYVFDFFVREIENNRFFAKKECCRVFKKKGYYSRDREKDIIFDIAIEISLPGYTTYSTLILIECKNYNHKVPVDDVEEFFQKTQQVAAGSAKGVVVTTNGFQESAFTFSKSKGLGLARYCWEDTLSWELTRAPSSFSYTGSKNGCLVAYNGLRNESLTKGVYDFFGVANNQYSTSIYEFFNNLIAEENLDIDIALNYQNHREVSKGIVNFIAEEDIEDLVNNVLSKINYSDGLVEVSDIGEFLQKSVNLDLRMNASLSDNVLGTIKFNPLTICIDSFQSKNVERIRFTLAHEFGHYFLGHSKYVLFGSCFDSVINGGNTESIGLSDIERMEWQANKFASSLLLPQKPFIEAFMEIVDEIGLADRGHGYLYLDDQICNLENYYKVTTYLMKIFKVSRQAVKYRLLNLGLLNDRSITSKSTRFLADSFGIS